MSRPSTGDLIAGVSVALVAIPQSLAYAELAGLPAHYGLYATALPSLLAAFFVSSRYLQTGPVALTALLTLGALSGVAEPGGASYIQSAALLALLVGIIRVLLGVARMGRVAYVLSEPVVTGFTAGAAVVIIASQLPKIFDVYPDGQVLAAAVRALGRAGEWRLSAIAFAAITVCLMLGGRHIHRLFPGVLVAVITGVVIAGVSDYAGSQVGDLDGGFIPLSLDFPWSEAPSLLLPAAVIALVGFAEPASIARTYAAADRLPWNANREMVSQGVANLASAVSGAFPVGGSFSRSSLNRMAGATSAWSGAITGAFVLVVLPLPVGGYVISRYTREVRRMWRQVRAGISELVAQVQDSFSGITEIKSFGKEKEQAAHVASSAADYRDKICEANKVSLLPSAVVEFSGGVGVIVAVWMGGSLALAGTLNVADLFVFIAYLTYIYQPFLKLADISDTLHRAGASQERIFELLAVQPEISSPPDAITPRIKRWDVSFRDVSFGYQSEEVVLNGIDFEIGAGEMVALVGATGAGKTTVSRLIPRFYDPLDGQVCIGGHDLRSLDLGFLRANVASVMQDVFLFHGTVRQNIAFGRPNATVDEIVQAAQASNAHEFVVDLPDGYNTIIGERGVLLSGGQKQRISIARALLKDAPILILDEATSSVDSETEWLIQQALNRLTRNRTTLVIAHRLSTIRHADKIVVLDGGRIIEAGAHDELMARGGRYAQMVETQSMARSWQLSGQPELQPAGD